jgi:hypothetical protein
VATLQAAIGAARPPCRHINIQSCAALGLLSRFVHPKEGGEAWEQIAGGTASIAASIVPPYRWGEVT